jgi:hypothetical protein
MKRHFISSLMFSHLNQAVGLDLVAEYCFVLYTPQASVLFLFHVS